MDSSKRIPLTQGQFAVVDAQDYEFLCAFKWCAQWSPSSRSFYAHRRDYSKGKAESFGVAMHREIMGLRKGDGLTVDHINRDTLDNRRSNLRLATASQNQMNRRIPQSNKSGFKGVCYAPRRDRYSASITINGKQKSLGYRRTAEEASLLYRKAAREHFGEFARFE